MNIGELAELLGRLYYEAGEGLWKPENKEFEEQNRAYIFRYIAVRLLEKEKLPNSSPEYRRGYNTGYKAGKAKRKSAS